MGEVVLVLECQDIEGKLITSFDNWVVEKASRFFFWEISNWHTPKKEPEVLYFSISFYLHILHSILKKFITYMLYTQIQEINTI